MHIQRLIFYINYKIENRINESYPIKIFKNGLFKYKSGQGEIH